MSVQSGDRSLGLSAFVRCRNEEEYIVPCVLSLERFVDEIVVVVNRSTDRTRALVEELMPGRPKLRLLDYDAECEPVGAGYSARVRARPEGSLAAFYNWCTAQTTYSYVCKWDGDMLALPPFERARDLISRHDAVAFDGWDLVGAPSTDLETRIFRFDPARARYEDWDLYEILRHDYGPIAQIEEKCYLHTKLGKREWLNRPWNTPNWLATESVPPAGSPGGARRHRLGSLLARPARMLRRALTPGRRADT